MRADVLERFAATTETIREPEQLRTYECDGLTGRRVVPSLVALPGSVEEVQAVVRLCNDERIPFVARAAGAHPRRRPRARPGGRRAGRREPRCDSRGRRCRLLLRARPLFAAGL